MPKVTGHGVTPSRTSRTIWAFWRGDTLQAITTEQSSAMSRNCLFTESLARISSRAAPVTISALSSGRRFLNIASAFVICPASGGSRSRVTMLILSTRTLELKPIFRAVSNLSPVRTQTLMPAFRNFSIVSGTWSCSLSSIAVIPRISTSFSRASATLARAPSRSVSVLCASLKVFNQSSATLASSFFFPTSKVLKPSVAKLERVWSRVARSVPQVALSFMTLSAPFTRRQYSSLPFLFTLTSTDIRFRSELKALVARTS
mmetsp:Transcript_88598/g.185152  ORF Transcript_88598/g.185152 Transcript_88598/m.185152 type:complete len:260 (-) Transcript_88598:173-952(-)